MKATVLALSISAVFATQTFASQTVDRAAANAATEALIADQMATIDASVQAALNAQYGDALPGEYAVIDDVTYEKQANGTWAVVGGASAAIIAGLFSTSTNSNGPNDAEIDFPNRSNPVEGTPEIPSIGTPTLPTMGTPNHPVAVDPANPEVKWGKVEVQDATYITKNGEIQFVVYEGIVFNASNYEPVGKVSSRPDGKIYKIETANGGELLVTNRIKDGAEFTVTKADGSSVNAIWTKSGGIKLAGDIGQGPEGEPMHPDYQLPEIELPILGTPEHPVAIDPANPNVKWGKVEVQDATYITKNGDIQFVVYDGIVFNASNYEPVGKVSSRPDGKIYKIETANGGELLITNRIKNGAEFTVTKADGSTVDMLWTKNGGIQIAGDIGQGPEWEPEHPDYQLPEIDLPIEGNPETPDVNDPVNPIQDDQANIDRELTWEVSENSIKFYLDGEPHAEFVKTDDNRIVGGVIGGGQVEIDLPQMPTLPGYDAGADVGAPTMDQGVHVTKVAGNMWEVRFVAEDGYVREGRVFTTSKGLVVQDMHGNDLNVLTATRVNNQIGINGQDGFVGSITANGDQTVTFYHHDSKQSKTVDIKTLMNDKAKLQRVKSAAQQRLNR